MALTNRRVGQALDVQLLAACEAVGGAVVVGVSDDGGLHVPEAVDGLPGLEDAAHGREEPLVGEGVRHLQAPPELGHAPLCNQRTQACSACCGSAPRFLFCDALGAATLCDVTVLSDE